MTVSPVSLARWHVGRRLTYLSMVALLVGACSSASGASTAAQGASAGVPAAGSASATSAAGSASAEATSPAAPSAVGGAGLANPVGGPVGAPAGGGSGVTVAGGAVSGQAIAYPYPGYPGAPGLAPDHTIVVTGLGQATMAPDQSDRATAQQAALKAALADARSQADIVATATGATIEGVLSVSVSMSQGYCCAVPMAAGGAATGPGTSGTVVPMPIQPPSPPAPELDVTVTVAYRIG
jgi:hypothetical protein